MTIHTTVAVDAGTGIGAGESPSRTLGNGSIGGMWLSLVSSSTADSRRCQATYVAHGLPESKCRAWPALVGM